MCFGWLSIVTLPQDSDCDSDSEKVNLIDSLLTVPPGFTEGLEFGEDVFGEEGEGDILELIERLDLSVIEERLVVF